MHPESLLIKFESKVRCSMASLGQPWMLQRARWEQDISASKFDGTANTPNGPFKYWFATQDIDNYDQWSKSTSSLTEGVVINIGVMCESSGISKVICRQYSSSNQLSCVTFHEIGKRFHPKERSGPEKTCNTNLHLFCLSSSIRLRQYFFRIGSCSSAKPSASIIA